LYKNGQIVLEWSFLCLTIQNRKNFEYKYLRKGQMERLTQKTCLCDQSFKMTDPKMRTTQPIYAMSRENENVLDYKIPHTQRLSAVTVPFYQFLACT